MLLILITGDIYIFEHCPFSGRPAPSFLYLLHLTYKLTFWLSVEKTYLAILTNFAAWIQSEIFKYFFLQLYFDNNTE